MTDDGLPVVHARTGEPLVADVIPMMMHVDVKPDPGQMIAQTAAAKLAAVSRQTIWRAMQAGALEVSMVGGSRPKLTHK